MCQDGTFLSLKHCLVADLCWFYSFIVKSLTKINPLQKSSKIPPQKKSYQYWKTVNNKTKKCPVNLPFRLCLVAVAFLVPPTAKRKRFLVKNAKVSQLLFASFCLRSHFIEFWQNKEHDGEAEALSFLTGSFALMNK